MNAHPEIIILEKRMLDCMTNERRFDFVHRVTICTHHASGGCTVTHVVHSDRFSAPPGIVESYGSRRATAIAERYLARGFKEVG